MPEIEHIFSSGHLLVGLGSDVEPDAVNGARNSVVGGGSVDDVLAVLTSRGLASTPAFFCAESLHDGVRILIRGDVAVDVRRTHDDLDRLTAGRSGTWRDDVLSGVETIVLVVGGATFEWRPVAVLAPAEPVADVFEPDPPAPPGVEAEPASVGDHLHTLAELPDVAPAQVIASVEPIPEPMPAPPPPPPAEPGFDFSNLLDRTQFNDVEAAAVRHTDGAPPSDVTPEPPPAIDGQHELDAATTMGTTAPPSAGVHAPPPPDGLISDIPLHPTQADDSGEDWSGLGDHDGHTVALGAIPVSASMDSTTDSRASDAGLRSILCPRAHANPPTAVQCRICDAEIVDRTVVSVPRPVLARLTFSTGLVVDVDRPQVIGRRPTADDYATTPEIPNLVTLASPDSDISRNHLTIRLEGWNLLIEDQGSTNGTEVRLPGQEPMRLREHNPVLIVPGTEVTLAGMVTFSVDAPR